MASKRKFTLIRSDKTKRESNYTVGGRLKSPRAPITLPKLRPVLRRGV